MKELFHAIKFWVTRRRVCAWCVPKRYLGGNPFARKITDGICPNCLAAMKAQLAREAGR